MTDLANSATGELLVSPAEAAVREMLAIPSGVYGIPMGAQQIDQQITELADLLEHVARVIVLLYEERHRAEEKWQGAVADYMVANSKYGPQMARQIALANTKTELHNLNLSKEKLRYAEEMQKSLQNRSFGLMNIGKRFTHAMGFST